MQLFKLSDLEPAIWFRVYNVKQYTVWRFQPVKISILCSSFYIYIYIFFFFFFFFFKYIYQTFVILSNQFQICHIGGCGIEFIVFLLI